MIWLVALAFVVILAVALLRLSDGYPAHDAAVQLHAIRQRLNVALFKLEVQRDAARLRRQLERELDRPRGERK